MTSSFGIATPRLAAKVCEKVRMASRPVNLFTLSGDGLGVVGGTKGPPRRDTRRQVIANLAVCGQPFLAAATG